MQSRILWALAGVATPAVLGYVLYVSQSDSIPIQSNRCAQAIDVDPGSSAYNQSQVQCVEKYIGRCEIGEVSLLYGLGSLKIFTSKEDEGRCNISIEHEIEMGVVEYDCSIPIQKLKNWQSWKEPQGLSALDDIKMYCVRQTT